ncbi:MAG: peptidylprolyl isomerase [Loktanella sp.]|nr:peptidylprolyl isomerase [Loktanella sp.]
MRGLLLTLALWLGLAGLAQAQFSPAITVNNDAITQFELTQRATLLEVFRTPGNTQELAREQLIEESLKLQELNRVGVRLTDEAMERELEEFAGRADMTLDQFLTMLGQNGVERATLEQFVRTGVTWRDYIRQRYASRAEVTEAEVDRAMGQGGSTGGGIEVLLSEIIIPAPPPEAARATAIAEDIAAGSSFAQFEAAAREYSALPSRQDGGRLGWLPIGNYPEALQGLILSLAPGEVTPPLQIPNGVALFQMRDVREVPSAPQSASEIEYAAYYIAGGRSDAALQAARGVELSVDTCDDLYGVARNQPADVLQRDTRAPASIPQDIAMELAKLDAGEVSYNVTSADGQTLVFLMLCNRSYGGMAGQDRDAVRNQVRSQRLAGFADALLADLRATATIRP